MILSGVAFARCVAVGTFGNLNKDEDSFKTERRFQDPKQSHN